jgi:hypothetical protein
MEYRMQMVLLPYVASVRARFGSRVTAMLTVDVIRNHNTLHTREFFRNDEIRAIELRPHTTHLYQLLDLWMEAVIIGQ